MKKIKAFHVSVFIGLLFFGTSFWNCVPEVPPTKTLMQGNWQLINAVNDSGADITSKIAFPVTVLQLMDDNGMVGTIGPMFMYLVYGESKWVTAAAKIKQAFDYANFRFNSGEFFVAAGNVDEFTLEGKLQATALAGGLNDLLTIFGVGNGYLQTTIYHKFLKVKVSFPDATTKGSLTQTKEYNKMVWEVTSTTSAAYNYKDSNGNSLIWNGWPVNRFTKGKFTFEKKIEGLNDIVKAHL